MLVEVAKEDLSKISSEESIHVAELKKIKKYSHVMHIVCEKRIKERIKFHGCFDLLPSCRYCIRLSKGKGNGNYRRIGK